MKSLWLWRVSTILPIKSGWCGESEAKNLANLLPTSELKLLTTISGKWSVGLAWCLMSIFNLIDDTLNMAVGPSGKFTNIN